MVESAPALGIGDGSGAAPPGSRGGIAARPAARSGGRQRPVAQRAVLLRLGQEVQALPRRPRV